MEIEGEILRLVNQLLEYAGRRERVSKLEQCNCELIYSLYCKLFNEQVTDRPADDVVAYQHIIDGLSGVLPAEISLTHITGVNIANEDNLSLRNLLQILRELFAIKVTEHSDVQASLSSSLCTDDTQVLLQVNAISQRVAIAKRELSASSSSGISRFGSHDAIGVGKFGSHDAMRTPSPRRHSSSFTPLLMSTPHPTAKSRLEGVANNWDVPEVVESISSINSEVVAVSSAEMVPSLTITTMSSSSNQPIDTTGSHDATHESHDASDDKAHNINGSCDSSDVVTTETDDNDTIVEQRSNLNLSGSHDTEDDSSVHEESSHDPHRSVVLDKVYQKYIRDKKLLVKAQKAHRPRKKLRDHQQSSVQQPLPPSDNLMNVVEGEFPFLQLSPSMARQLWQKQLQQVKQLSRPPTTSNPAKKIQEAERRQRALLGIIRKELTQQQRMEEIHHRQLQQQIVKARLRAHKMAAVRTKRYYRDYELRLKAKMQRKRTREEQVFRKALEEGLELQKNRIRELQQFAKEKRSKEVTKHAEQLESLENYYRDQFMLLAEEIANEKTEKEIRGAAQQQLVERMKRELRNKMEEEIRLLQDCIDREDDDVHFRQLDSEQFLSYKLQRLKLSTLKNM